MERRYREAPASFGRVNARASEAIQQSSADAFDHSGPDLADQGEPEPIGDVLDRVLRDLWWRSRRAGHDLPAYEGLILIRGGGDG